MTAGIIHPNPFAFDDVTPINAIAYEAVLRTNRKYIDGTYAVELLNVHHRSNIQIHYGGRTYHSEGCYVTGATDSTSFYSACISDMKSDSGIWSSDTTKWGNNDGLKYVKLPINIKVNIQNNEKIIQPTLHISNAELLTGNTTSQSLRFSLTDARDNKVSKDICCYVDLQKNGVSLIKPTLTSTASGIVLDAANKAQYGGFQVLIKKRHF